MNSVVT